MATDRYFLDSSFVLARFNRRDQYHAAAKELAYRLGDSYELVTTDAILLEVGAAFRQPPQRSIVVEYWQRFHGNDRYRLMPVSGSLLERAVELFRNRTDKSWSLTDCASFVLMSDLQIGAALSSDSHFVQAGFRALLLD